MAYLNRQNFQHYKQTRKARSPSSKDKARNMVKWSGAQEVVHVHTNSANEDAIAKKKDPPTTSRNRDSTNTILAGGSKVDTQLFLLTEYKIQSLLHLLSQIQLWNKH